DGDGYRPAFLVVDRAETLRVVAHAAEVGEALAAQVEQDWPQIRAVYQELRADGPDLAECAFVLVGSQILDVGLLRALEDEGTLMPPAPARPGPDTPDACYYFWMIEGDWTHLGDYGRRSMLLAGDWTYFTFGSYRVNDVPNAARNALDEQVMAAVESAESPEVVAEALHIPLYNRAFVARWSELALEKAKRLVGVYQAHADALHTLYDSLRASAYTPYGFGEFFCWYDHVAYAAAIDALNARGLMDIPPARFSAALWAG
ncbi:MAG: hypothetical protein GYB65_05650, partial [Chloroflexi bacterium]|nr:hypothetical protein [Chloroflexota bacterium]